jgi:hypothetical protein
VWLKEDVGRSSDVRQCQPHIDLCVSMSARSNTSPAGIFTKCCGGSDVLCPVFREHLQ